MATQINLTVGTTSTEITLSTGARGPQGVTSVTTSTTTDITGFLKGDGSTVSASTIVSADISDATSDGYTNRQKVLKTDANGNITLNYLTIGNQEDPASTGHIDLVDRISGNTVTITVPELSANADVNFLAEDGDVALRPITKSANFTAANGQVYHITATCTVTDPSPVEGKGFEVLVRNGTATVGGTAYASAGTVIKRIYHSGAWSNTVYDSISSTATLTNKTIDAPTISGAAAFTSTTRPTSAGTGTPAATSLIHMTDLREWVGMFANAHNVNWNIGTATTNAGGISNSSRGYWQVYASATASSGAMIMVDASVAAFGSTSVDWSRRMLVRAAVACGTLPTGKTVYIQFGRPVQTVTFAQLAAKGFGIKIEGTTATPFVHDGSSITNGSTFSTSGVYTYAVDYTGGTNVKFYTVTGTGTITLQSTISTGLPTSTSATAQFEVMNYDSSGAGATANFVFLGNAAILPL